MESKIRVAGILNDSITDGPGLRMTIFMQGCNHNCPGCHNPQSLDANGGVLYTDAEIILQIKQNPLLSGITFSGGEPLLQAKALLSLARNIKELNLGLAIYTGYTFEEIIRESNSDVLALLHIADTLIDGPFLIGKKSLRLPFRGSSNQRILSLPESLRERIPVLEKSEEWFAVIP